MKAIIGNSEPSNIIGMKKILFENQQAADEVKIFEYVEDAE